MKRLRTPAEVTEEGGPMTQEEFRACMEAVIKTQQFYANATIDEMYLFTSDPEEVEELVVQAERENKILVFNIKEKKCL